jgi:hypothetical protein
VANSGWSLKYRDAFAKHAHLPVPTAITPGEMSSQVWSQGQRRLNPNAQPPRFFFNP